MDMLIKLLLAHFICDYPLQGDFLSRAKSRRNPVAGIPWWIALGTHAFIHGSVVYLITGNLYLGAAEMAIHATVDHLKCEGHIDLATDQAIHIICKLAWRGFAWIM